MIEKEKKDEYVIVTVGVKVEVTLWTTWGENIREFI